MSVIIGLFLEYVIFLSKSFHLYGASLPQVGFALQSGLNVIPCFGEKLEEREAGRTMEVETLTFIFAFCEIMDHGGRFSFSYFCLILKQCWVVNTTSTMGIEVAMSSFVFAFFETMDHGGHN